MIKLKEGDRIRITGFNCGNTCEKKFSCLGILEGRELNIITMQPFNGPVTVAFGSSNSDIFTIGRKMFKKIMYELIK